LHASASPSGALDKLRTVMQGERATSIDSAIERRFRLRGAPIIHDTIDNETIAINQLTGAYYSLEGPAALVWLLLADGATAGEVGAELALRYTSDDPLQPAVQAFLDELLAEELVVVADAPADTRATASPGLPDPPPERPRFPGLRLQRYTDLEVMLLADPIHEVDETGWPMPLTDQQR
jgi:hypothetical protein